MKLVFKTKNNPCKRSLICQDVVEFILNNRCYVRLTLALLERKKTPTNNIVDRIDASPEAINLKHHREFMKFKDLMNTFYNTAKTNLNDQRGCLLELLVSKLSPLCKGVEYKIIPESIVLHKGRPVSPKDIDIVFEYHLLELFECKATLGAYLSPVPLEANKMDKLAFIEKVKVIANTYSIVCNLFLATYSEDKTYSQRVLSTSGFKEFHILNRSEIISRLAIS